jgi:sulfoxide reductase heme-binding subunit YedZ
VRSLGPTPNEVQEKHLSLRPAAISATNPRRSGDQQRRLLRHHVPVALASVGALVLFMTLPAFDRGANHEGTGGSMGAMPEMGSPAPTLGDGGEGRPSGHGGGGTSEHGADQGASPGHGGTQAEPTDHARPQPGPSDHGGGGAMESGDGSQATDDRSFVRRFTTATGYVATGLLAVTLLIGPVNLVFRRRNPVSSYLRRDVGAWAAIFSVVHVFYGFQVHAVLSDFLTYFFAPDGSPLTDSFGLGNWTGLAATVIVVGLLAISSNVALRKLTARPWKRLQRLNYALFALVIAHAIFYGALSRVTSPFTLLLGLSIAMVFVGQAVGVWLWRQRLARVATT